MTFSRENKHLRVFHRVLLLMGGCGEEEESGWDANNNNILRRMDRMTDTGYDTLKEMGVLEDILTDWWWLPWAI
jgi:hypothetical protein